MRYRMNKLIKLLENEDYGTVQKLYNNHKKYRKAFESLADLKVIEVVYAEEHPAAFWLNDGKAATYALSRYDIWVNRILGFVAGVLTSVAVYYITQLLNGLLG